MDGGPSLTLVTTRIEAPAPPSRLVSRPGLTRALDDAVADPDRRLVLLSAPAGSGKSTLVSAWVAGRGAPTAWLQCETSDGDPARFWQYVVAALGRRFPGVGAAVGSSVAASAGDAEPLITRLVNSIAAAAGPVVFVIDDLHLIGNPAVHEGLERLIELSPGNLTVVACTRVDPPLRLSRMRVRGALAEMRADALRFSPEHAASLLRTEAGSVADEHVEALWDRTEGWAAGLVLAAMSLASTDDPERFVAGFQGDDRLVVEYLTDEFLAGLDDGERDRMLRTSILARMTGPLVDAVCDVTDGTVWLRHAAAKNQLLIGLDTTGTWFRYHHLLGDLLRLDASRTIGGELGGLHLRAAAWHHHHGDAHEAVEHYLAGGDRATAAQLIWDEATDLLNRGQLMTVLAQVERLGPLAAEDAGMLIVRGWIAQLTGHIHGARCFIEAARQAEPDDAETGQLVALSIINDLAHGEVGSALAVAESAGEPQEATQAGALGIVAVWAGRFGEARRFLARAALLAEDEGHTYIGLAVRIYSAIVELEDGDDATAARLAGEALQFARERDFEGVAPVGLAHVLAARTGSDHSARPADALRGVEMVRRSPAGITLAYTLTSAADVLCDCGHPDGPELVREARSAVDDCPDPGIVASYLSRVEARHGTVAVARHDPVLVEQLTERELATLNYLPTTLSQREIANELYVSVNTVKTHCRAIFRKLGVGDRRAAVQAAREHGLL